MGSILSATGSVLHPNSNEGSYKINYLLGRFIIFEDGHVQQHESWTISCVGSSCLVITNEVNGRLIAAEPVQVIVGTFPINSST
uniref:AT-hook motif nuclear-localized protein n=1 Tax=Solanum tuberosum TaxID=4113 RepID=M1BTA1_SOLTU